MTAEARRVPAACNTSGGSNTAEIEMT